MDSPAELNWLSHVAAPMLVQRAGTVVAMNPAAAALFAHAPAALPMELAALVGPDAARAISAALSRRRPDAHDTFEVTAMIAGVPRGLSIGARLVASGDTSSENLWALTLADGGVCATGPAGLGENGDAGAGEGWLKLLPTILDQLPVALLIEDDSGLGVFVNNGFTDIFQYQLEEIADIEDWWLKLYPDPVLREEARRDWSETLSAAPGGDGTISTSEFQIRSGGGTDKMVQFHSFRINGYRVHSYVDVTHRHRLAVDLQRLADTDALTGVLNRRSFFHQAARLARSSQPFAALLLDVDHFKQVNDRLGHGFGDQVLVEIAARLRSAMRAGDVLARMGGEEFALLLPGQDSAGAALVSERLRSVVADTPIRGTTGDCAVTVSVGGACAMAGGTIEDLLARADAALYAAKRAGRNCVRFDSQMPF